jgi:predicted Rossmann-fold nucleotide-binding protein
VSVGATRLAIVGVMGSGSDSHRERAAALGQWLAREGVHLLTGGGSGVMSAVSEAFCGVPERRGLVIGVLPGEEPANGSTAPAAPRPGYPNPWVEIPIFTHLPLSGRRGLDPRSRNHINVLSSDVLIALPGGAGTASEVALALRYRRPVIAHLDERGQIDGLPDEAVVASDLAAVQEFVRSHLGERARPPRRMPENPA